MSIILKPSALKVKDDNGNYIGTNMFAAESTQEYLDAIETIGTQTQTAIQNKSTQAQAAMEAKAEQTIESIPEDYTELAGDVTTLKADLSQKASKEFFDHIKSSYKEETQFINPLQYWDVFDVVTGYMVQSNGNKVASDTWRYIELPVSSGTTFLFATPDPTTATGVKTGNAGYICFVKTDGSYYYTSPTEAQWKHNITVPEGVDKMIVSIPDSRLYGDEFSIVASGTNVNNQCNPWKPKYSSKFNYEYGSNIRISCIGDSLTEGSGGDGTSYPSVLAENDSNLIVTKFAFPSEDSYYGALITGGINVIADPFTIPASNSASVAPTVTLKVDGKSPFVFDHIPSRNICKINGVEGYLLYSNGVNKFQRSQPGEVISVDRPQKVHMGFEMQYTDNITIVWLGTNDNAIDSQTSPTLFYIQDILNLLKHKKYLVIGVMQNIKFPNIDNIATYYRRWFGNHFINLRQYLLDYGLADAGITPTAQDTTDISNGTIPTSLRSDETHLNASGYTVVGNYIYNVIKDRGWLDS